MKTITILNLPYKSTNYDENEIKNFERWIELFCNRTSKVILTPPIERQIINFSKIVDNLNNFKILPVPSFDTCDRWKAGLSEAINDEEIEIFCFWSADFKFNTNSEKSAKLLLDYDANYDLVVGTIDATGRKELIDSLATIPLIEHWFPKESYIISEKGFSKPRSELFKISKNFASFLLSNRWYPSEQTINILLQCIWENENFTMKSISLSDIEDDEQDRKNKNVIQQIERMELWLKYIWREKNKNWSYDEYLNLCDNSYKIVKDANTLVLGNHCG